MEIYGKIRYYREHGSEHHIHSGGKNCGNAEAGGEKTEGVRRRLLPRFHGVRGTGIQLRNAGGALHLLHQRKSGMGNGRG